MKYTMTYTRTFHTDYECPTIEAADARAKIFARNFAPGEVNIVSIYAADYVQPVVPPMTKMEAMVDGMRKNINRMLNKEPA